MCHQNHVTVFIVANRGKTIKGPLLQFYARCTLSHTDDLYNKLKRDIGNDFNWSKEGKILELYSFHCSNCGYRNIHDIKMLTCGCGKELQGILVYRKIGDTVIYDARQKRKRVK
jgi:hypothetical protein